MTLCFAREGLEREFYGNLHDQCVDLAYDLARWSKDEGIIHPVITGLSRGPEFYTRNNLKPLEFSWHYRIVDPEHKNKFGEVTPFRTCAIDFRNIHYTAAQRTRVEAWFRQRCSPAKDWELIMKTHGTGPHIHVAFRDARLRKLYEAANPKEK